MSGPIVRKYGFPNFEQIFGERELQHGVEEEEESSPSESSAAKPKTKKVAKSTEAAKPATKAPKRKKGS
jgi:hypothetical protein